MVLYFAFWLVWIASLVVWGLLLLGVLVAVCLRLLFRFGFAVLVAVFVLFVW